MSEAAQLNMDATAGRINSAALDVALQGEGAACYQLVKSRGLFADVSVFVSATQLQQMQGVISAVERVVNNDKWIIDNGQPATGNRCAKGVFYGYDFHLNAEGAHLIEINTNAGGAFLNRVLIESQRTLPGDAVSLPGLDTLFVEMFRREWQLARGEAPLGCIAIVDEQPEQQYLYPEFLIAQRQFERAGIRAVIVDPAELRGCDDGLYLGEQKIDLIYNRLTDFTLQQYPVLLQVYLNDQVVLTPNPEHYERYADKRNLARLTDADELRDLDVCENDIATLLAGIPHTFVVRSDLENRLWSDRKSLFFKPCFGYASRGAYRGEKLTRRVFGEILQAAYVAQQLAAPGERAIADDVTLKYDVRCYVYDGVIQLVAARLYQGQTTNFRTMGGGFAQVRRLG
ncbi:hypothetical protein [Gallionella capsiferriformans]|uniref:Uncharacterized protein n=1 Tax=Gallionella capsiferriformans (strain ES-2) TaxID=395494 RepID=D9SH70_GALCS|nr:hypothetical protein [Gallionella capsiferriformans]ADL55867.1 hypothetical protein Galf_1857 [Gallionella capsiferriformans ES-2]